MIERDRFAEYAEFYRKALLQDVVPFWEKHSPDREHGGYYTHLARDGSVVSTDKLILQVAREILLFCSLYRDVEPREEWLDLARLGYDFFVRFGFGPDGQVYRRVAEDGSPIATEDRVWGVVSAASVFSEYGSVAGDEQALERARQSFRSLLDEVVFQIEAVRCDPTSSTKRRIFNPALILGLCHHLRKFDNDPLYDQLAHEATLALRQWFAIVEEKALFGVSLLGLGQLDYPETRRFSPGEFADWAKSLLEEGRLRNDLHLCYTGGNALDFALAYCWDSEYGGLLQFTSLEGGKPQNDEWGQKVSWAHCEMLNATLLAYRLTGEGRYLDWFFKLHEWVFAHFPDKEHGEWIGILNRDGTVADDSKSSPKKDTYHISRALLACWRLFEELQEASPSSARLIRPRSADTP